MHSNYFEDPTLRFSEPLPSFDTPEYSSFTLFEPMIIGKGINRLPHCIRHIDDKKGKTPNAKRLYVGNENKKESHNEPKVCHNATMMRNLRKDLIYSF